MSITAAVATGPSAWDFSFTSIDGDQLALSQYEGQAVLVVNTASRCGFTPQYDGLQELWQDYKDRGRIVNGVPSDAIVLFSGNDLNEWVHANGESPMWVVKEDLFQVEPGSGDIFTKKKFGMKIF